MTVKTKCTAIEIQLASDMTVKTNCTAIEILTPMTRKSVVVWVIHSCSSHSLMFWRNILPTSSRYNRNPSKKAAETATFYLFLLIYCLAYFSTIKCKVIFSSETSGALQTIDKKTIFIVISITNIGFVRCYFNTQLILYFMGRSFKCMTPSCEISAVSYLIEFVV